MPVVCIIAEAGVAHNGSLHAALDLAGNAKKVGADVVKFQTYIPELLIRNDHEDYELLKRLALPFEDFLKIAKYCDELDIEFMSTPGDLASLHFLARECRVRRIKIGSDDIANRPLLDAAMETGKPLLVSTGMADWTDVQELLVYTNGYPVTLMQCTSIYPCPDELVGLAAIRTMRMLSGPVGYSDHTKGELACIAAVAAGATVIEKHFMLPRTPSVDEAVSLKPQDFAEMVYKLRRVEALMGSGEKRHTAVERDVVRRLRKRGGGPFRPEEGHEVARHHHGTRGQQAAPGQEHGGPRRDSVDSVDDLLRQGDLRPPSGDDR